MYAGWQIQPRHATVQAKLKEALERMVHHRVHVIVAGRADSGVHAMAQVANVRVNVDIPCRIFLRGLNSMLPDDVVVLKVEEADPDFHAQKDAVQKIYRYVILNAPLPSPF